MEHHILVKGFFKIYRYLISPFLTVGFGIHCRFNESCSLYTERMIQEKGFFKGTLLGSKRFFSCHPFSRIDQKHS